jgi:hypothetical protein
VPSRDTTHVHLRANRKPKVDQRLLHIVTRRARLAASGSGAPKHPPYMYTVKGKAFMSISFAWSETQSPRMHLPVRGEERSQQAPSADTETEIEVEMRQADAEGLVYVRVPYDKPPRTATWPASLGVVRFHTRLRRNNLTAHRVSVCAEAKRPQRAKHDVWM